jgi:CRP/FNR family transcriptional regulator
MKTIVETDTEFICDIQIPCFQALDPDEVNLVRASKTQVLFRKGDNLTKQGAFASYVLFIINGLVKQYIEGSGNRSFNLRIITPGEFVGLSSVFRKNIFNYSSIALTDCQAFLVEKTVLEKVVKQNGEFAFRMIQRYCEQNDKMFETINNQMFKQMNGRLADALIYINSLRNNHSDVFQLLSRKDVADFTGISTESTVKLLKSFEKDGLITLKEKDIYIEDEAKLKEISKIG